MSYCSCYADDTGLIRRMRCACVCKAVRDLYEVKPGPVWPEDAERRTKLVGVGRGLNLAALQQGLDSCA